MLTLAKKKEDSCKCKYCERTRKQINILKKMIRKYLKHFFAGLEIAEKRLDSLETLHGGREAVKKAVKKIERKRKKSNST